MATATIPAEFECPRSRHERTYVRHDGQEPGVRLVAGQRYIYDAGDLLDWRHDVAVYTFPASLSGLSYEELKALKHALQGRTARLGLKGRKCPATEAASKRLWVELPTRPEYQRAFGPKAVAQAEAA